MSAWRDATAPAGSRWGPSRRSRAGALVAATIVVLAAAAAIGVGGFGHGHARAHTHARTARPAHPAAATSKATTQGSTGAIHGANSAGGNSARGNSLAGGGATAGNSGAAGTASGGAHGATGTALSRAAGTGTPSSPTGALGTGAGAGGATGGGSATTGRVKSGLAGARGAAIEIRDPEESRSFPAPPGTHHSSATSPGVAAEAGVAPGAAPDAQIRKELNQLHAIEREARSPSHWATVPGGYSIAGSGKIPIPQGIPAVVQHVIAGADAIADFPYVYGGGHASFVDDAYDCSGSVSYALAAGGLLSAPETSGQLESWGAPGPGKWITVYANAGHTYMYVNVGGAWMLYDTAGRSGVFASRWQPYPVNNSGYVVRHWPGL